MSVRTQVSDQFFSESRMIFFLNLDSDRNREIGKSDASGFFF